MNIIDSIKSELNNPADLISGWRVYIAPANESSINSGYLLTISLYGTYRARTKRTIKDVTVRLIYKLDSIGEVCFEKAVIPNSEIGNHDSRLLVIKKIKIDLGIIKGDKDG